MIPNTTVNQRPPVLVKNWLGNERKRFAALLDPVLMMLVDAMVLVIVLSILLPIFDLQTVIGSLGQDTLIARISSNIQSARHQSTRV